MTNQRVAFIEKITKDEIEGLKKSGNLNAFNMKRIQKNYDKDMKAAKNNKPFDDAFTEEGYKNFISKQESKLTSRQEKLIENYIRGIVRKTLNKNN